MRHVYECPVRRADLHPGGAVSNVAYVDYLQEARLDLPQLRPLGGTPIAAEMKVRPRRQASSRA